AQRPLSRSDRGGPRPGLPAGAEDPHPQRRLPGRPARRACAGRDGGRQYRAPDAGADDSGKGSRGGHQPHRGGLPQAAGPDAGRGGKMNAMQTQSVRHFLDLHLLSPDVLRGILTDAARMEAGRRGWPKAAVEPDPPAADRILAMIFEKPSTRTRLSFDSAMRQLGGETIVLRADELQTGRGESIADTARILSANVDAIMMRTGKAKNLTELADNASVPVINGLTDDSHPCQVMA